MSDIDLEMFSLSTLFNPYFIHVCQCFIRTFRAHISGFLYDSQLLRSGGSRLWSVEIAIQ